MCKGHIWVYGRLFCGITSVGLLLSTPHNSSLIALNSSGLKVTSRAPNIDPQL